MEYKETRRLTLLAIPACVLLRGNRRTTSRTPTALYSLAGVPLVFLLDLQADYYHIMRRDLGQSAAHTQQEAEAAMQHEDSSNPTAESSGQAQRRQEQQQYEEEREQSDVSIEEAEDEEMDGEQQALVGRQRNSSESTIGASTMKSGRTRTEANSVVSLGESAVFRDRPQSQPAAVISSRRRRNKSHLLVIWQIAKEALPTLVLSLLSLMFSGELLVHLARWPVFLKVDKLFILLPILLNLKGNLEMNLSLRMSTSANIGELDIRRTRQTLIVGNMTLLQVQALIVSAGAGVLAFLLGMAAESSSKVAEVAAASTGTSSSRAVGLIRHLQPSTYAGRGAERSLTSPATAAGSSSSLQPRRIIHHHPKPPADPALRLRNGYFEFVLVLATGMLSASISSAILGNFMCALVVVARQVGANPDNIASPLAASLGDLLTLIIVGLLASFLINFEGTILASLILLVLIAACIICFVVTLRNTYVRELLSSGWVPLIIAMFISSGAGLVLDSFVQRYPGFALLSPVVTGLPGACAAIFVSRISTTLHSGKGELALADSPAGASPLGSSRPTSGPQSWVYSGLSHFFALFQSGPPTEGWMVPLTLLVIGFSIETLFLLFVWVSGQMHFGWQFVLTFCTLGLMAVGFALWVAHSLTLWLWKRDYDPGESICEMMSERRREARS
jgi:solute carrier family 41